MSAADQQKYKIEADDDAGLIQQVSVLFLLLLRVFYVDFYNNFYRKSELLI